jgi:hypothetical protein
MSCVTQLVCDGPRNRDRLTGRGYWGIGLVARLVDSVCSICLLEVPDYLPNLNNPGMSGVILDRTPIIIGASLVAIRF